MLLGAAGAASCRGAGDVAARCSTPAVLVQALPPMQPPTVQSLQRAARPASPICPSHAGCASERPQDAPPAPRLEPLRPGSRLPAPGTKDAKESRCNAASRSRGSHSCSARRYGGPRLCASRGSVCSPATPRLQPAGLSCTLHGPTLTAPHSQPHIHSPTLAPCLVVLHPTESIRTLQGPSAPHGIHPYAMGSVCTLRCPSAPYTTHQCPIWSICAL